MHWFVGTLLVLVCLSFPCQAANIFYINDYVPSPNLILYLEELGHTVTTSQATPVLNSGSISLSFDIVLFQNEGGQGWSTLWSTTIDNYVRDGGVLLYFGRDALISRSYDMFTTLGFSNARDLSNDLVPASSIFQGQITYSTECFPLVNGLYWDLRGQIPVNDYPGWTLSGRHLNDLNSGYPGSLSEGEGYNYATTCLYDSYTGYPFAIWSIRTPDYSNTEKGRIVFMSTTTAIVEEFYKKGFYQRGLLNLISYSATGLIFGDPYVVTLAGQTFTLPEEASGNFLSLYQSETVQISGKIETHAAGGIWVTEVGVNFVVEGISHQLHCYVDLDDHLRMKLDGEYLIEPQFTENYAFLTENKIMVGAWHNRFQFESPGVFKTNSADDGTVFLVQAVMWNYIPSFAIEVHPSATREATRIASRSENGGLLQHPPTSSTRELGDVNVLAYAQEALF